MLLDSKTRRRAKCLRATTDIIIANNGRGEIPCIVIRVIQIISDGHAGPATAITRPLNHALHETHGKPSIIQHSRQPFEPAVAITALDENLKDPAQHNHGDQQAYHEFNQGEPESVARGLAKFDIHGRNLT